MRPWCRTKGGSYKEYIKNKPICWGIKVWVLCEAKRGYVCNFDIYLGKEEGNVEHNLAWRDGVVCSKIVSVQDFSKNFQNKTNAVCHPCQMAHNLPPLPHAVLFLPHSNHWRQRLFLWIQRCSGKKEKGKASGACILLKLILQKAWWPTTPKLKLHQGHCFLYNYKGYVWENLRNFTAFHKKCLVIST